MSHLTEQSMADAIAVINASVEEPLFDAVVPIALRSAANAHDHYWYRVKRSKSSRMAAHLVAKRFRWGGVVPLLIVITRVAPRALDKDNNAGALKAIQDGLADRLRIDDRDPIVTWQYQQRKTEKGAKPEVRIAIFRRDDTAIRHTQRTVITSRHFTLRCAIPGSPHQVGLVSR